MGRPVGLNVSEADGVSSPRDWRLYQPIELTPILANASQAFYEQGFHGTTVRDIARRVGVTIPALYYHHENKEAILVALLEIATSDIVWRAEAAAKEAGGEPRLELANTIEAIVLHMTIRSREAALDSEMRHLSTKYRKHYAATRKILENLVSRIILDGQEQGAFTCPQPEEASRALLGMCQAISRWYDPEGDLTPQDVAKRYVELALMMVGASVQPNRPRSTRTAKPSP